MIGQLLDQLAKAMNPPAANSNSPLPQAFKATSPTNPRSSTFTASSPTSAAAGAGHSDVTSPGVSKRMSHMGLQSPTLSQKLDGLTDRMGAAVVIAAACGNDDGSAAATAATAVRKEGAETVQAGECQVKPASD